MKVLITGATGFIGRALCRHLGERNWIVRASGRSVTTTPPAGATEVIAVPTIDKETDWRKALDGIDAVVHLAARVHVMHEVEPNPVELFRRVNVEGTQGLVAAAREAGVRRFLYLSSVKVNGEQTEAKAFTESDLPHPDDPYGISKWEAEQSVWSETRDGLTGVVLRPPMVYGPNAPGNFSRLIKLVRSGIPIPLGSVNNRRSFIYVENLCDAIRVSIEHPKAANETFLVSDGEDISTPELIHLLGESVGSRPRVIRFPVGILRITATAVGRGEEAERLLGSLRVDVSKIRRVLGWKPPYSLRQGLAASAETNGGSKLGAARAM